MHTQQAVLRQNERPGSAIPQANRKVHARHCCLALTVILLCLVGGPLPAHAQDSSPAGKWHFVLDTPGGDREVDADFTIAADGKVTGTFGKTDAVGIYKDGQLDLNFQMTSEESGDTGAFKLLGKMDDNHALTGTWEFTAYSGTFKASRPKP